MNLKELEFPREIIDCVENDLGKDIQFDGYSFKGSNGYILFGNHNIQKKRVAIKFYYFGEDYHDEVSLLSQIKSPNLLNILHARTIENGYAYFVTEEITGGDLDNYIGHNRFSQRHAVNITKGILNGIIELHKDSNRLLHRDLKPANILIDSNNNPLIADFGSLKRIPDGQIYVTGSKHAALYRPPESHNDEYTFCSDVYQVGLVFYQLLGGYLNYNEESYLSNAQRKEYYKLPGDCEKSKYIDLILKKLSEKRKLVQYESLPHYVGNSIQKIIAKATNPDPDKRYASASEFMLKLHELGPLPDWNRINNEYWLLNHKKNDYRIVPCKKHRMYECIKSKSGDGNWRRESIDDGSQADVIQNLIKKTM